MNCTVSETFYCDWIKEMSCLSYQLHWKIKLSFELTVHSNKVASPLWGKKKGGEAVSEKRKLPEPLSQNEAHIFIVLG